MEDATEQPRRELLATINADPGGREALEARHGRVWDTDELTADFEVTGFMAPIVAVVRRADKRVGSLEFQARPRFYFNFQPHDP